MNGMSDTSGTSGTIVDPGTTAVPVCEGAVPSVVGSCWRPPYASFAKKSKSAIEREEAAKRAFLQVKLDFEANTLPGAAFKAGQKHRIRLLEPGTHLTQSCWFTFSKWVKEQGGVPPLGMAGAGAAAAVGTWQAKRRAATEEEKANLPRPTSHRKGKVYFVDVVYTHGCTGPKRSNNKKKKAGKNVVTIENAAARASTPIVAVPTAGAVATIAAASGSATATATKHGHAAGGGTATPATAATSAASESGGGTGGDPETSSSPMAAAAAPADGGGELAKKQPPAKKRKLGDSTNAADASQATAVAAV